MMNETGIRPQIIQEIKELAQKYGNQKVIMFGSRARANYRKVSDIDVAVSGGNIASFSLDVEEETTTLLKYDVVNLDGSVQKELLDVIEKEGVMLYEKI